MPKAEARNDRETSEHSEIQHEDEGLCFTAGLQGAPFGAGVIHAYLTAGRKPPRVVAGISMGSLTAAAFQRAYKECLRDPQTEAMRWQWYRRYLQAISERPFDVLWSGIPDQSDFFAEFIPVKDPVPETIEDLKLREDFNTSELQARRDLTLFVKLGHWLSRLPIKTSAVANFIIHLVRWQEKYGPSVVQRCFAVGWDAIKIVFLLLVHNAVHPQWVDESQFVEPNAPGARKWNAATFVATTLIVLQVFMLWVPLLQASSQTSHRLTATLLTIVVILYRSWIHRNSRPLLGWPVYCLSWGVIISIAMPLLAFMALVLQKAAANPQIRGSLISSRLETVARFLLKGLHVSSQYLFSVLLLLAMFLGAQMLVRTIRSNRTRDTTQSIEHVHPLTRLVRWAAAPRIWGSIATLAVLFLILLYTVPLLSGHMKTFFAKGRAHEFVRVAQYLAGCVSWAMATAWLHRAILATVISFFLLYGISRGRTLSAVFKNLNLHKALVNNYYLKLALFQLFQENGKAPILSETPFPVVLVAAPLQVIPSGTKDDLGSYQVWAKTGTELLHALCATLAIPGIYEPIQLKKEQSEQQRPPEPAVGKQQWWNLPQAMKDNFEILDLVDGSVIRQNPLPALFSFIAQNKDLSTHLSTKADGDRPKVHVVYSVPIDPGAPPKEKQESDASIVDVGLAALKLSRRRDTQLEVHQTNLLSKMELEIRKVHGQSPNMHPIFVDEIAPDADTDYKNPLNPTRTEVLNRVASGCRATLEVLYADKLAALSKNQENEFVKCTQLVCSQLSDSKSERPVPSTELPGLSEVCLACTRLLKAPQIQNGRTLRKYTDTWSATLPENENYHDELPQLAGTVPRIVFVASGGVFRGSFHAGMIAALLKAHIKPDLVVGASVGTIMGGALAAAFCAGTYQEAVGHLAELTSVLLSVDKTIAFTKPFKNAVRDLGIRARGVPISPNDLRKMVLRGSEYDPSFAAVGAPSALIDGISHLLLIPHRRTSSIAADFVAGHVTDATKKLLRQLKNETLKSLNIEYAIIGTSLLQPTARRLLAIKRAGGAEQVDLGVLQPYQAKREIAVYGTTISYWEQRPILLGAGKQGRGPAYDFVEAVLCSSAFPCVFSSRRESALYPGTGSPTTLFCDGGMFDNLPFLPAIEIMSRVQSAHLRAQKGPMSSKSRRLATIASLEKRRQTPDLFIAGSLNVNLQTEQNLDNDMRDIIQISKRASALQYNVKIKAFEQMLLTMDDQLRILVEQAKTEPEEQLDCVWLDKVVNAAVLPIYPADQAHLNGTFAFCASTGLKKERLKDSLSNGCFQTFRGFVDPGSSSSVHQREDHGPLARSLSALREANMASSPKLPAIGWSKRDRNEFGICKFFLLSSRAQHWPHLDRNAIPEPFKCPFYEAAESEDREARGLQGKERKDRLARRDQIRSVYDRCIADPVHLEIHRTSQLEKTKSGKVPSPEADVRID